MPRDFELYLNDILTAIGHIQNFTGDIDKEAFSKDELRFHSTLYNLMVIGEAVKNLPDELQAKISEVPWRDIKRFRDKVVHHYFAIRPDIVWQIVQEDLPVLQEAAKKLLEEQDDEIEEDEE